MFISKIHFHNYKSFLEPEPLEFREGFNIISGQNNAGKTALLEILGLSFSGTPHRSLKTIPARDTLFAPPSWIDVSFTVPIPELKELILGMNPGELCFMPEPNAGSEHARNIGYYDQTVESKQRLLNSIFSREYLVFDIRFLAGPTGGAAPQITNYPSFGVFPTAGTPRMSWQFQVHRDGTVNPVGGQAGGGDFGLQLANHFRRHVYKFAAERLKIGRSAHGVSNALQQDASNLPEVLNQLQHNPHLYRSLNEEVSKILPQVKWVSVRASSAGLVEVMVWSHDPETRREDLAIPLSECGTGIGQVVAMVYVVMLSNRPQTVIIDEPQSFLHPGAIRKLIDFLKGYPKYQFIMATHSATVIAATEPKTITLVSYENSESNVRQLDVATENGVQRTLGELGIRLSDHFGADNILWVEGRTEEQCFPIIVNKIIKRPLKGTEILGIRQTGDLEGRDAKRVFEIYRSLSKGASLLPPALVFILDDECRTEEAKKELNKLSGGLTIFIPRRMFENYLLHPEAIASVASGISGFRDTPLTEVETRTFIDSMLVDKTHYCAGIVPGDSNERIRKVDGGRVLSDLFKTMSQTRVSYEKVVHGIALTEWIVAKAPEQFQEICKILTDSLDRGERLIESAKS